MKKILLFLFFAMPLMGFAQKSYITLYNTLYSSDKAWSTSSHWHLTGDISEDLINYMELRSDNGRVYHSSKSLYLGEVLNKLSAEGYELEFAISDNKYILSKNKEGSSTSSQKVKAKYDTEP